MTIQNLLARYRALAFVSLIAALILSIALTKKFDANAQSKSAPAVVSDSESGEALSATISGRVFQDFNSNGAYDTASGLNSIDKGVSGVTVTAFDAGGVNRGSAVSDSDGNYSLNATGTGPYRVEFTTLPAGFSPSARSTDSVQGGTATDAGSTVQFVLNSNTPNVNLALERPEEYCQNNPDIVISRFVEGAQNGVYGNNSAFMNFPYNSGTSYSDTTVANYDSPSTHSISLTADKTGTIFSLAYSRSNRRVYAASYFKRHAGFGPGVDNVYDTADDPAAIYVIDPALNVVASTFSLPGVTTNSHAVNDYGNDNDDIGWDAVGKTSIGGMDLADDDSRLFAMNLQTRQLYALNPASGASLGNTAAFSTLSLATPGGSAANCPAGDIRPFAVNYYRGKVYVGVVCSAESTNLATNLFAYVVEVNPTTMAVNPAPVFSMPLNYPRGFADPGQAAAWRAWRPTISTGFAYPQPMFTDIEFENGNMMIGLRDRAGDQAFDNGPEAKRTAGDTLRACGNFGAWTLESNGRCGSVPLGTGPQGNNQGPGGGEYYHQDDFCLTPNGANYHDEVSWGVLLYVPGREHVLTTLLDPISRTVSSGATFDGGLRWLHNTTGNSDRAYRVYNGTGGANVPDFGKANGLGGTSALCDPASIEIGNRIWRDMNNNGVQDPGESPMQGITVRLYQGSTLVATAVTDVNGEYYFVSSTTPDGNTADSVGQVNGGIKYTTTYQVRLDNPTNYTIGNPLFGLTPTVLNQTSQPGDDDASDSDAMSVTNPAGSPAGVFPVVSVTTGGPGSNDHTFDIGFAAVPTAADVSVGGRVITPSGQGLRNAKVVLTEEDGTRHTTLTGSFGYYNFDGIQAGQPVRVSVASKRFTFNPSTLIVYLTDSLSGVDFVAEEQ